MMVGKGITYDTGGADIKAGGNIEWNIDHSFNSLNYVRIKISIVLVNK